MALKNIPACPICNRSLRPKRGHTRMWCIDCHHWVHPDDAMVIQG